MLTQKIDKYLKENYYPFHMPGHKRNDNLNKNLPYRRDFTEIEGFDNLNCPNDIFVKMEEEIAKNYKVKRSIISTNGSTCGILASIRSLYEDNKKILIQRSSHKSVYNACLINHIDIDYINVITNDISAIVGIDMEEFEEKLKSNSYFAVVVTSPSYEGYELNLKNIYKICKKYNTKLIVDMAHGSHLFLDKDYESSFDLAITSFHKNLSALTPSAAVLINDKSLEKKLRFNMSIFQTSSPSYVILQSIDEMIGNFANMSKLKEKLDENLKKLYKIDLKNLRLYNNKNKDRSKILVSSKYTNINGQKLLNRLKREKIEIEMAYPSYALLIATIFDNDYSFDRLIEALIKIDNSLLKIKSDFNFSYIIPKKIKKIYECEDMPSILLEIDKAAGKISKDFLYAYPPGIPILTPGELIDNNIIDNIKALINNGININIKNNYLSCLVDK